jgi:hypothetical protein
VVTSKRYHIKADRGYGPLSFNTDDLATVLAYLAASVEDGNAVTIKVRRPKS